MNIENTELLHTDVLIIGGGTAGMEAACTAAEVGCTTFLLEKKPCLYREGQKAGRLCGVCEEGRRQYRTGGSAAHDVRGLEPCDGEDGTAWTGHLKG